MDVKGIVISVDIDVQVTKNGGGTYPGSRLTYRDESGAAREKAFHNNVFKFNPVLKTQLSNLLTGQAFVMNMEKEGEFWNVKSILPSVNDPTKEATFVTNKPVVSPKSTYETPEERAKKQVYIVRQSSITNAIALKGNKASVEEIINVAKQFETFVFGGKFDDGTLLAVEDDSHVLY